MVAAMGVRVVDIWICAVIHKQVNLVYLLTDDKTDSTQMQHKMIPTSSYI
jgi:hypothetical protein